jgi:hypothetical protein
MKNAALGLLALLLTCLSLNACKKDDDKGFRQLLVGKWASTSVKSGGNDVTSIVKFDLNLQDSYEFELDITTTLPISGGSTQSYGGDWLENEQKRDITLVFGNDGSTSTYEVEELTDTVLRCSVILEGLRYTVTFEKQ